MTTRTCSALPSRTSISSLPQGAASVGSPVSVHLGLPLLFSTPVQTSLCSGKSSLCWTAAVRMGLGGLGHAAQSLALQGP